MGGPVWTCLTAPRIIGVARRIDRLTRCPGPRPTLAGLGHRDRHPDGAVLGLVHRRLAEIERRVGEPVPEWVQRRLVQGVVPAVADMQALGIGDEVVGARYSDSSAAGPRLLVVGNVIGRCPDGLTSP
jgi:hypothetical protein